jgi:hypothetical protein
LRQKYRKLALPAVVAAVSAKKGKAAGEKRESARGGREEAALAREAKAHRGA